MSTDTLKAFSEELVNTRNDKNITIEQVASQTRIDIKFLKAIEAADFEIMPEVYMRAFIKGYAQSIDLDPDVTLKKFELAKVGKSIEIDSDISSSEKVSTQRKTITIESELFSHGEDNSKKTNTNKSMLFAAVGGALIIVSALAYFFIFQTGSTEIVREKPFAQVLEEKTRFEITEDKKAKEERVKIISDSLLLRIEATDTSWIKVLKDDKYVEEFIIYPNRVKTVISLNKFNLLLGNARGLTFYLNDKVLEVEKKSGRQPNVEITLNEIVSHKKEIDFPNEANR